MKLSRRPAASDAPLALGPGAGRKGLKSGALGLCSSVAIGLASTAPAYSIAATLGLIVAGVGLQAPIITILAFIPMLLIAYAYKELNASNADCGTTFTWATRAFGPRTGWMGGWGIIVADIIVMANLAEIAGIYGFRLLGYDSLTGNRVWVTIAGVVWIIVMTAICYIGIEISAAVQRWLLFFEVAVLVLFAVTALVKVYTGNPEMAIHVSASWFNPLHVPSVEALTTGILAAVFIYWGWDTAVTVNEETADSTRIPGRAAVISVVLLLIIYVLVTTSAQAFAGVGSTGIGLGNRDNAGDVLSGLGNAVFGSNGLGPLFAKLLILMVLTSAVASTQTTILPMARTVFSMAAHKAVPSRFARLHRRFLTPTWSTISLGLASIGFYVLLTAVSRNVLADSVESVGLAIAFYYGLTGFACVWYFRSVLTRSLRDFLCKGLLPGLGGLMMLFLFCYAAFDVYADPGYGETSIDLPFIGRTGGVTVMGLGALLLGVVLMLIVTREHTAALRLQRSMLPHRLPQRTAVEMASRYVPADSRSGVGGDWFDVIPLSGTRVGLVVGEVTGYGLLAAATMGRLRTGVRVLARLDLAPDELLSRLDDLAEQTAEERAAVHGAGRTRPRKDTALGLTCLYAVYDPVSGQCSMARAGHSLAAVVLPDSGVTTYPELPAGPPLGLGGLPYETTEFQLPQGSLVALFTDGLVQAAADDLDVGLGLLAETLVQHRRSLEELCDRAVATLVPGPANDDAVLLLVRTRMLGEHQVAVWELTAEPAMVGKARAMAMGQLGAWGLDELSFTTELIVSELVTNAIRYAAGPIHVRLIRDQTLICEVADTGHTSPHLRHAAADDESGRGLFIVAQIAQQWGTRYTPTGKTIWVEQALPESPAVDEAL
ncbi:amino acid permease [Streptomyces sp. NBC_00841]|uniref:SpoIIE family protein phosphatase n=1 Tax=unclassified Streptomyces TaxID=2593676 RepID=UPI00224E2A16|nr:MULTISPECIES: amino acid permease [unclassified Streptomyces]MCX4537206.1 amino acid permease [Streptomyces sp. NBC_01669]WRZ97562.1 amino acid permease [Streptomyces sp. NBC_00841]